MNILFFGPNGSGKGTQGSILKKKYKISHIESGAIFRKNISQNTELGIKAKTYINKGDLVPDNITIPMILNRLKENDCKDGWLLDGFPRNYNQAVKLNNELKKANIKLDIVVEILLNRKIAKNRIMGRRLCVKNNNHPNNIFIEAIKPINNKCRICKEDLKIRNDDQDEMAIDKRHNIYYNAESGTLGSAYFFKKIAEKKNEIKYITLNGEPSVENVTNELISKLK